MSWTRRELLVAAAGAGAGAVWLSRPRTVAPLDEADLDELVRRIRLTPHRDALALVGEAVKGGVDRELFLGAVFLAGVHEVSPWPCGGDLHSVMCVDSVRQITRGASVKGAWLATAWSLDYFKEAQQHDVDTGDWTLGKTPVDAAGVSANAAAEELEGALRNWDYQRADRAIAALARHHDRDALFEHLWPWAGRCVGSLAHKVIYTAQAHRTLGWLGTSHMAPVLRSLVRGMLFRGGRSTSASDRAQGLLDRFPETWSKGKEDPDSSLKILRALRTASFSEAQDLVLAAFTDGLGPQTVWDGLRLYAAELFALRRTDDAGQGAAVLPVHLVTALHGFAHAFRTTQRESTKRLLLLQAAGWLPQLRAHCQRRVGLGDCRRGRSMPYEKIPEPESPVALEHDLFRSTVDSHQYKLAAALVEEARHAAPRWQAHLLGTAYGYLPPPGSRGTSLAHRSERVLEKAGLR